MFVDIVVFVYIFIATLWILFILVNWKSIMRRCELLEQLYDHSDIDSLSDQEIVAIVRPICRKEI